MIRVDVYDGRSSGGDRRAVDVALGAACVVGIQGDLASADDVVDAPLQQLGRREDGKPVVGPVVVVAVVECPRPFVRVGDVGEAARVVRGVLEGLELRCAEGIVVADTRPRMTAFDAESGEHVGVAVGDHRRIAIGCTMRLRSATWSRVMTRWDR